MLRWTRTRKASWTRQKTVTTPRFDDHWRGVEWFLARRPEKGTPRSHQDATKYLVYVFPQNTSAKTRELWVLYSYDDDRVDIHLVRFGAEDE